MDVDGGLPNRRPAFLLRCLLCNCRVDSDLNAGPRLLAGLPCGQFLADHICDEAGDECRVAERVCEECFSLLEQWQSMQRILEKLGCSISDKYRRARLKRRAENVCIGVGRLAIHLRYVAFLTHIKGRRLSWDDAVHAVATSVLSSAAPATETSTSSSTSDPHVNRHRSHQQQQSSAVDLAVLSSPHRNRRIKPRFLPGTDCSYIIADTSATNQTGPSSSTGVTAIKTELSSDFFSIRVLGPGMVRSGNLNVETSQLSRSESSARVSELTQNQQQIPVVRIMYPTPSVAPSVESDVASVCSTDSSIATVATVNTGSTVPAAVTLAAPAVQQLGVLQNWCGLAPPLFHHPPATTVSVGAPATAEASTSSCRRVVDGGAAGGTMSLCDQLMSVREREETMSVLSMADTASLLDRTETLSLLSDNTDTTARLDEFSYGGSGSVRSGGSSLHGIDSGIDTASLSRTNNDRCTGGSVSFLEPYSKSDHGPIESGDDLLREFADTMSNISEGVILEDLDAYFEDLDSSATSRSANGSNNGVSLVGSSGSTNLAGSCCVSQRKSVDSAAATSVVSVGTLRRRVSSSQHFNCALCDCCFDSRRKLRVHTRRHGAAPFRCRLCRQQFAFYYKLLLHTRRAHIRKHSGRMRGTQGVNRDLAATCAGGEMHGSTSTSSSSNSESLGKYARQTDGNAATNISEASRLSLIQAPNISDVTSATDIPTVPASSSRQPSISSGSPGDSLSTSLSCDQCGRMFRQACTLRRHRRMHAGDGRFTCNVCDRRCISGSDLRRHLDTHQSEKQYVCPICSRAFKLATSLALHRRLHSSAALQCAVCDRQFDRRDSLTKHMDTHKTERDLICDICGRRFKQQRTLAKHRRVMHPS